MQSSLNRQKRPPGISRPRFGFTWRERLARGERGQSLVEMTIGFVVLLILLSGLLDLGRAYFTFIAMEDGVGEAALYAAINPTCLYDDGDPSNGTCDPPDNAEARARNSGGALVDWTAASTIITITCTGSCDLGDTIEATIQYPFELLTPVIPTIANANTLTLTAHATQSVIGD